VHCKPGADLVKVARNIESVTGLGAKTTDEFRWSTIKFFLYNTGITINFAITILLGVIVGIAVAGQTFFTFTIENEKQFGALKAMGVSNFKLVKMVLLQAFLVGIIGWGIGVGATGIFAMRTNPRSLIAFLLTPELLVISFVVMTLTVMLAAIVSIRRVLKIEPAIVFR
jgi:putative ABC transport system permease protein